MRYFCLASVSNGSYARKSNLYTVLRNILLLHGARASAVRGKQRRLKCTLTRSTCILIQMGAKLLQFQLFRFFVLVAQMNGMRPLFAEMRCALQSVENMKNFGINSAYLVLGNSLITNTKDNNFPAIFSCAFSYFVYRIRFKFRSKNIPSTNNRNASFHVHPV